jgi:hypothetical protein
MTSPDMPDRGCCVLMTTKVCVRLTAYSRRYDHDVVLAFPPHMGQALPFVHRLPLPVPRGLPEGRTYAFSSPMHAASLEALQATRPTAVGLARTK